MSFKPYYKWMTFNTNRTNEENYNDFIKVLNLIING